jgi:hypothetical protein
MEKSQLISLFDQDQRIDLSYPKTRREVTPQVVRHIDLASELGGFITYSQMDEANVDEVIQEQLSFFAGIGQGFEWKVYDYDRPSDLKERLAAQGFQVDETEAVMVLDLNQAPDTLWQPVPHRLERIVDPQKLADVQAIEETVWERDASWVHDFLGDFLRNYPDQMQVYVAYVEEQPASAGWVYFQEGSQFASLWGGATIAKFRKQGLFSSLLAIRAQAAKARQTRYLRVDAMPMSRPILERHGFEVIAYSYPCHWNHND